jgi:hypothetical protein
VLIFLLLILIDYPCRGRVVQFSVVGMITVVDVAVADCVAVVVILQRLPVMRMSSVDCCGRPVRTFVSVFFPAPTLRLVSEVNTHIT